MSMMAGGPRVLLRHLRQTMAEPLGSQDRLNKIVDLIAQNMGADVCSFYVLRDDAALELFATHGLKTEAVHMTTLRLGEGLVGLIASEAEALALDDARQHPAFAYREEGRPLSLFSRGAGASRRANARRFSGAEFGMPGFWRG